MKWTMNELGLMSPLNWSEWILMACVFGLLILAGWVVIEFFTIVFEMMKE